ncbi:MAG TPA: bifunctional UDP-N-acetylglucosamine diphosphorylase/glucosamine-1-phosphate N-acetyltransferase GlmU [Candidatus Avacidaminococcus intestinavium]|uniref:Bifunctional protein GlmU n=1 Tax=Candidatus Avacidaminococcus intestinavium TaxID=2840684 RepID=A0A9D1SLT0_9FIRM|nr:bifunctional UDP-N-acetylglucosamine diphosphorylase/glucosamine-1-phosphate N-acetyltransferase GlmU [Candidatus Avacidaminococcus intestinavium]
MSKMVSVILAAGKGTRMKSRLPKVLHKIGGAPMLSHVLQVAKQAGASRNIVVVGYGAEQVVEFLGDQAESAVQTEQLGTGHAVLQTEPLLKDFHGTVMVICGDTPLLEAEELRKFYEAHRASAVAASVLTAVVENPSGYGRILRDSEQHVLGIVEEKDATMEQKAICEINTGIYCLESPLLFEALSKLSCNNAQGEYYLTDVLVKLIELGKTVGGVKTADFEMIMGINSRKQLAEAEGIMRRRTLDQLMENGVTIMDPASTFIDKSVVVGQDTVIYPFTWLEGTTVIGKDCQVGPNVRLTDVQVGAATNLQFTYGHECSIGEGATVGPYVHLRPQTKIGAAVKVGNFVEVKNSEIGAGSKLPHLSYIGDSDIGERVNIGCGCITVNYDGKQKHRTVIADDAFIGCNSNLLAPVTIGKGAYVGAGSTITKEVEENDLAVARAKQTNIKDWAEKYRKR